MFTIDNAKTEIMKTIDYYETLINAWKNVKRKTKKDGSSFAALAKNFENASVHDSSYSLRPCKEISVCGFSKYQGWITDKIETTDVVQYSIHNPAPERIIKETFLNPYFFKTVDEIFIDIENRIKKYQEWKQKAETDLEKIETVLIPFVENVKTELEKLKESAGKDLYYQARDFLKDLY